MPWIDVFIEAEARYREQALQDTWGHLAPKKNKTYRGFIVFAVGCFGSDPLNPTPIQCEFKGLDSSPWFYDHLTEFLSNLKAEEGCVYRWEGSFRNYEFRGVLQKLELRESSI